MNFFKKLAIKLGSQKNAAKALGVAPQTYSDWVTEKKHPGIAKAKLIRTAFKTTLDDIYG